MIGVNPGGLLAGFLGGLQLLGESEITTSMGLIQCPKSLEPPGQRTLAP